MGDSSSMTLSPRKMQNHIENHQQSKAERKLGVRFIIGIRSFTSPIQLEHCFAHEMRATIVAYHDAESNQCEIY